jgi:hypothetical protein
VGAPDKFVVSGYVRANLAVHRHILGELILNLGLFCGHLNVMTDCNSLRSHSTTKSYLRGKVDPEDEGHHFMWNEFFFEVKR